MNHLLLLAVTAWLTAPAVGQIRNADVLIGDAVVDSLMTARDSLHLHRIDLLGQASLVGSRINLYGEKSEFNARDHRNLEKLMQQSQHLEKEIAGNDSLIRSADHRLNIRLTRYIESCRTRSDSLVRSIEERKKTGLNTMDQQKMLRHWIAEKMTAESLRKPEILSHKTGEIVKVTPWDTPQKIRLKGDLLSDQEDVIRQEIKRVDGRIQTLERESDLRTKIDELDMEVDLFNEREELLTNNADAVAEIYDTDNWFTDGESSIFGSGSRRPEAIDFSSVTDNTGMNESGVRSRTPADIRQTISRLFRYRERLSLRADSLQQRAEQFYESADVHTQQTIQ